MKLEGAEHVRLRGDAGPKRFKEDLQSWLHIVAASPDVHTMRSTVVLSKGTVRLRAGVEHVEVPPRGCERQRGAPVFGQPRITLPQCDQVGVGDGDYRVNILHRPRLEDRVDATCERVFWRRIGLRMFTIIIAEPRILDVQDTWDTELSTPHSAQRHGEKHRG